MNSIIKRYKIPFLISLVTGIAMVALVGEEYWLNIVLTISGALVGMSFLDLEYILFAYLVDPLSETALEVKKYVESKKLFGFVQFLNESEYKFKELSLRIIFFQVLLVIFASYIITTNAFVFVQGLTLSVLANLLYAQMVEFQDTKTLQRWFWIYSGDLSRNLYIVYMFVMLILLVLQYSFL